ncbi:MAG: multiprotein-bridging factor 1 family protein [Velocimicrobium sp.]
MAYIGNIIKEYRNKMGISRKELSENICSEKYVYLIEKGTRTPSVEVSRAFGDRMGVDLFKYYEYLDCINPIEVEEIIGRFNKYRIENDMDALQEATDKAFLLPDFHRKPWVYEIDHNRIAYMTLKEGRCCEAIKEIKNKIQNVESKYSKSICFARFYILLSTCYQMIMDLDNAQYAVLAASEIIANKQNVEKNAQVVIAVKISEITLHYLLGELDKVIEEGCKLNQYQIEMSSYELGHHGLFYLAYAHYQKGLKDEGVSWFLKALYASLIRYKPRDIYYLSKYEMFQVLSSDYRVPSNLVNEFKRKYNID